MSQMFRSFEANSGTIQRKGSEDLAKSSTSAVDQSNLGQAPELARTFVIQLLFLGLSVSERRLVRVGNVNSASLMPHLEFCLLDGRKCWFGEDSKIPESLGALRVAGGFG